MSFAKRTATIVLAAVAASVPLPQRRTRTWTVKGHGFGHGVGLCQYGAYGYAQHGVGYKKILHHYYRARDLGQADGTASACCSLGESSSVGFSGGDARPAARASRKRRSYSFAVGGGGVVLRDSHGDRLARMRR